MELSKEIDVQEIEIDLLTEGIFRHYGYDFRNYARASLKRRIWKCIRDEGLNSISGLQEKLLHDSASMEKFILSVSVNLTSMFRDPDFFLSFSKKVVPILKDRSFIRIWNAGCSTGEEAYSLAILLKEEELYHKSRIYATDMNDTVLKKAQSGVFPLKSMQEYTGNYIQSGRKRDFSEYYTARYDSVILMQSIKKNIVWAQHNLVTDSSFNEFDVIMCRNVMIYFNKSLQEKVHKLFYESLSPQGIFCLGKRESIKFSPYEAFYEILSEKEKIYKKVRYNGI